MEKKPFQSEYIAKLKETPVKLYMAYQKPYIHTYVHSLYWASLKRAFQHQYKNKLINQLINLKNYVQQSFDSSYVERSSLTEFMLQISSLIRRLLKNFSIIYDFSQGVT